MDEHVGAVGEHLDRLARRRVAGEDDPPARPRPRPTTCSGRDAADGLAALEAAEVGALGDAEPPRGLGVEAARAVVLDERVAVGLDAVLDRERADRVAVEADLLVRLELDERQRIAASGRASGAAREQRLQPGRAVDRQRPLARAQVERLEHPDQPEPVVEVEVGDEDRVELRQPDRAQELLLGALAAVEQDPVAARRAAGSPGSPRRAVGTEPAVPAKKSERSIAA